MGELTTLLNDVVLGDMDDRWRWTLDGSGDFSVASVRRALDDIRLPCVSTPNSWNRKVCVIPIKVNEFSAWKVRLISPSSRLNLSREQKVLTSWRKSKRRPRAGNVIELALWDDMARNFNKKESDSTEKTVIIAVSSCRVLTYGGLQLYSSPSTYYYLNPDIPDLEEFRTHLELLSNSKEVEKEKAKHMEEFGELYQTILGERDEEEDMREAFNVFDQNRDGFITIEELRSVLSSLGLMQGRSIEECRLIIKKVDEDGDGMVNCKELKQIMKARWFYRLGSLNVYQPR
ncbi:calmodulin-like protein 3 [Tanacetum coccineum]